MRDITPAVPGPGQVGLRVTAAGVNFIDVYHRTGVYPLPLPLVPGLEAAGVVEAVGPGVTDLAVGDRVVTLKAGGAYAQAAVAPVTHTVKLPAGVGEEVAAALALQGVTAHYLAEDTYPLQAGESTLIHAAAGGVGLLLVQWAKRRGARVLATVGTAEKAIAARAAGADDVVLYRSEDFVARCRQWTGGRGVDVVYDSVGAATFEGSLNCLRPRGVMVTFGNASGPVPPFAPLLLAQKGSLYLTRPTIVAYTQTREEVARRLDALFSAYLAGALQVKIGARYPLAQAAEAHRALEARATSGKVLLLPE